MVVSRMIVFYGWSYVDVIRIVDADDPMHHRHHQKSVLYICALCDLFCQNAACCTLTAVCGEHSCYTWAVCGEHSCYTWASQQNQFTSGVTSCGGGGGCGADGRGSVTGRTSSNTEASSSSLVCWFCCSALALPVACSSIAYFRGGYLGLGR